MRKIKDRHGALVLGTARRVVAAVGVAALLAAGCGGSSDDDTAGPEPTPAPTSTPIPTPTPAEDVPLALNHIQVLGSHNSYHLLPEPAIFDTLAVLAPDLAETREYAHAPLTEQLGVYGIRQFELDVYADPDGGLYTMPAGNPVAGLPPLADPTMAEPGFKVLHAQDFDYSTTCLTLVACLTEIADWSTANPTHLPVMIMIEYKSESVPESAANEGIELPIELDWTEPFPPTTELLADLDAEVRSVFDPDHLIEPDDVRGDADTLEAAVLDTGWPLLDDARGKVMIALIGGQVVRDLYVADSANFAGRPMFTDGTPGQPDAAFVKIDDPADPGIEDAVRAGYLVRTRTDSPTADARTDNTTRRDTALAGAAHFLSTDYYRPSEFFDSPYVVELPGDVVARCNPVAAPPSCSADQLTE